MAERLTDREIDNRTDNVMHQDQIEMLTVSAATASGTAATAVSHKEHHQANGLLPGILSSNATIRRTWTSRYGKTSGRRSGAMSTN